MFDHLPGLHFYSSYFTKINSPRKLQTTFLRQFNMLQMPQVLRRLVLRAERLIRVILKWWCLSLGELISLRAVIPNNHTRSTSEEWDAHSRPTAIAVFCRLSDEIWQPGSWRRQCASPFKPSLQTVRVERWCSTWTCFGPTKAAILRSSVSARGSALRTWLWSTSWSPPTRSGENVSRPFIWLVSAAPALTAR